MISWINYEPRSLKEIAENYQNIIIVDEFDNIDLLVDKLFGDALQ